MKNKIIYLLFLLGVISITKSSTISKFQNHLNLAETSDDEDIHNEIMYVALQSADQYSGQSDNIREYDKVTEKQKNRDGSEDSKIYFYGETHSPMFAVNGSIMDLYRTDIPEMKTSVVYDYVYTESYNAENSSFTQQDNRTNNVERKKGPDENADENNIPKDNSTYLDEEKTQDQNNAQQNNITFTVEETRDLAESKYSTQTYTSSVLPSKAFNTSTSISYHYIDSHPIIPIDDNDGGISLTGIIDADAELIPGVHILNPDTPMFQEQFENDAELLQNIHLIVNPGEPFDSKNADILSTSKEEYIHGIETEFNHHLTIFDEPANMSDLEFYEEHPSFFVHSNKLFPNIITHTNPYPNQYNPEHVNNTLHSAENRLYSEEGTNNDYESGYITSEEINELLKNYADVYIEEKYEAGSKEYVGKYDQENDGGSNNKDPNHRDIHDSDYRNYKDHNGDDVSDDRVNDSTKDNDENNVGDNNEDYANKSKIYPMDNNMNNYINYTNNYTDNIYFKLFEPHGSSEEHLNITKYHENYKLENSNNSIDNYILSDESQKWYFPSKLNEYLVQRNESNETNTLSREEGGLLRTKRSASDEDYGFTLTEDDFQEIYKEIYNSPTTSQYEKILIESLERVRRIVNEAGGLNALKKNVGDSHEIVKRQLRSGEVCNIFSRRKKRESNLDDEIDSKILDRYDAYQQLLARHSSYMVEMRTKRGINSLGTRIEADNAGYRQIYKEYENFCKFLSMAVFNKK